MFGFGRRTLLSRVVQNTEWKQLLDFVSPSRFEVMPIGSLVAQGRELASNASGSSFEPVREGIERRLESAGFPVRLVPYASLDPPAPPLQSALGQRVLEIYFAQLYRSEETDVRTAFDRAQR